MKAIRQVPVGQSSKDLFLTFDDGPEPSSTPQVLEILKKHHALATFFVVGNKIAPQRSLIEKIQADGHSIGNHSWDHQYSVFFKNRAKMKAWINESERNLRENGMVKSVGFRPPAGVVNPHLISVLKEMHLPLVLWSQRCFDKAFVFHTKRALKLANRCRPGDIVLLHDNQSPSKRDIFLKGLDFFLDHLSQKGFRFKSLNKDELATFLLST